MNYLSQNNYTIRIDSRKCSEGKTTQTLYTAIKQCFGNQKPFLIAAPTLILQNQHDKMIDDVGLRGAVVINSNSTKNVIKTITKTGIEIDNMAITHAALFKCTEFANIEKYTTMVDESPTGLVLSGFVA